MIKWSTCFREFQKRFNKITPFSKLTLKKSMITRVVEPENNFSISKTHSSKDELSTEALKMFSIPNI